MAVRVCSGCEELMQQGYAVERHDEGDVEYYCSDECLYNTYTLAQAREMDKSIGGDIAFHDWTTDECDEEDFFNLMNALLADPTPHQIADVMDVLHNTDPSHYGPKGVLDSFITYLNGMEGEHL